MNRRQGDDYRESLFDKMSGRVDEENGSKLTQSFMDMLYDMKEHKASYWSNFITSPIIGIIVSSFVVQTFLKLLDKQDEIYILNLFTAWWNMPGIIMAIIVTILSISIQYRFHKITKKDYYKDREGNFEISKSGVHGNAHWQTEKEREECFERSKDYYELSGDILGIDDKKLLYTLRQDLVGINRNKCIFGTPGSGKSAAIIENDIMKCMERGESAIITDSKGDLYRKLSQKARDNGYVVRVLNLKSNELRNSDAFHLLKYLENGDTSVAEMLANCIIENTGDGHMDYWAQNEMNGYKALLLYISTNEALKKTGRNTLAEMYNICTQNTPQQLATMFNGLPKTHPAKQAFNIYANCEPKVQGQILNGMGIKLSFLTDFNAQQIVSHDEIDLVLPMKKKCMYFVVIPDTNKTYNVIANLFFNMMLIKQCEYSDSLSSEKREKQIFVNYILDEFKATGAINNFDGTITTVRSRKIGITTVLQTLGQLQDMYPGMAYDTILGSMTTKILLRAGDETTSKYFTMICGQQTRRTTAGRYSQSLSEAVPLHNLETKTEGLVGADLLAIDETQKLDADDLVVCILGFQPVKLHKYLSKNNPELQEWKERIPGKHKPLWRKQMEDAEKERAAKREAMRTKSEAPESNVEQASSENVSEEEPSLEGFFSALNDAMGEAAQQMEYQSGYSMPFNPETGEIYGEEPEEQNTPPGLPEAPKEEKSKEAPVRKGKFRRLTEVEADAVNQVLDKF